MSPPTLPRCFGGLPAELSDYATARAVVLPVPYDLTTSYVPGARRGPEAIIEASRHLELLDDDARRDFSLAGVHTLEPLEVDTRGPEHMIAAVEVAVRQILDDRKFPLLLGGEHSVTLGALRAISRATAGIGVLQLDAHLDLRDRFEGSPFNHACVMRRARQDLGLEVAALGIRSFSEEEDAYLRAEGISFLSARALMTRTFEQRLPLIDAAIAALPEAVYLSCDLDVFDPAVLPATGTPEPGGLDWYTVVEIVVRLAAARRVVGADVVELAPIGGLVASDFLAAKLAYKIIGHSVP